MKNTGTVIRGKIIDGAVGTRERLDPGFIVEGYGIYLDNYSQGIIVEDNTLVDCGGTNIFLNVAKKKISYAAT